MHEYLYINVRIVELDWMRGLGLGSVGSAPYASPLQIIISLLLDSVPGREIRERGRSRVAWMHNFLYLDIRIVELDWTRGLRFGLGWTTLIGAFFDSYQNCLYHDYWTFDF